MMGRCGAALGAVVAVLGVWTAITMERFNTVQLHRPRGPMILLAFSNIVVFAVSFALVVYWRRNPEFHRRLMLVAACALTAAAFSRMPILLWVPTRIFAAIGVDLLILLGLARDFIVSRSIHRVYLYGFSLSSLARSPSPTPTRLSYWVKIAHAILD
jgi:hypothetical protein